MPGEQVWVGPGTEAPDFSEKHLEVMRPWVGWGWGGQASALSDAPPARGPRFPAACPHKPASQPTSIPFCPVTGDRILCSSRGPRQPGRGSVPPQTSTDHPQALLRDVPFCRLPNRNPQSPRVLLPGADPARLGEQSHRLHFCLFSETRGHSLRRGGQPCSLLPSSSLHALGH